MKCNLIPIVVTLLLLSCSSDGVQIKLKDDKKLEDTISNENNAGEKYHSTLFIMKEPFGKADQKDVYLYTLTNVNGIVVKITNYGGIITSILVPDKKGKSGDIVLGYDSLSQYVANNPYFGAIAGIPNLSQ